MANNDIFSNSSNYHSDSSGVNPRTGELSQFFNLLSIGHTTSLCKQMSVIYNCLSSGNFGLPAFWTYNISYIEYGMLVLDGGKKYQILSDQSEYSGLKYYKLKDLKFEQYFATPKYLPYIYGATIKKKYFYKLSFLDGRNQYFDFYGKLIAEDNKYGVHILYYYSEENSKISDAKLLKLVDSNSANMLFTYEKNQLTVSCSKNKFVVSFSRWEGIKKLVDPVQNVVEFTYKGGSTNHKLSSISNSAGLKIDYYYGTIEYKKGGTTYPKDVVRAVKVSDKLSGIAKSTSYHYVSDINVNNYTGFPKYSVDKTEDILMLSYDNKFHYITKVVDETCTTLYYYNRLHLELKREVYSLSGELIADHVFKYCGQDVDDYFPPYKDLPNNYQTPTSVQSKIYGKDKEGKLIWRLQRTDREYDDYSQLINEKKYNSQISTDSKETHEVLKETKLLYDYSDSRYKKKQTHYGLLTKKYVYDYTDKASVKIYAQQSSITDDMKGIQKSEIGTSKEKTYIDADNIFKSIKGCEYCYDEQGRVKYSKMFIPNSILETENRFDYYITDGLQIKTDIDANGNKTISKFCLNTGSLVEQTDPLGNKTLYTYDGLGRKLTATDALGLVTSWKYDDKTGKLTSTQPNGYQTYKYYSGYGQILRITDNVGTGGNERVLSIKLFNAKGQLISKEGPLGSNSKTTYEYNPFGEVIKEEDSLGNKLIYVRDVVNKRLGLIKNGVLHSEVAVDDQENISQIVDYIDIDITSTCNMQYDAFNKILSKNFNSSPEATSALTATDYDIEHNIISKTISGTGSTTNNKDQLSINEKNSYDLLFNNFVEKKLSIVGTQVAASGDLFVYNKLNHLEKATNNLQQTYHYEYDAAGKKGKYITLNGTIFSYKYYADGTLESMEFIDNNGNSCVRHFTYTTTKKVNTIKEFVQGVLQAKIEYEYTLDGQVSKIVYPDNKSINYKFNSYGQLVEAIDIEDNQTYYKYDAYGRIEKVYNSNGGVTLSYWGPEAGASSGFIRRKVFDNGTVEEYEYNRFSQLKTSKVCEKGNIIITIDYTYKDLSQNVASIKTSSTKFKDNKSLNNYIEYDYDILNRLIKEQVTELSTGQIVSTTKYEYDLAGNIQCVECIDESNNTLKTTYQYDPDNKLLSLTNHDGSINSFNYDKAGNLLNDSQGNSYQYSIENRLIKFVNKELGISAIYDYYPNGLRKSKQVNNGEKVIFYYDFGQDPNIINEKQEHVVVNYLMLGNNRWARTLKAKSTTTNYLLDNYHSIIGNIDDRGNLINSFDYEPYGEIRNSPKQKTKERFSIKNNPFGYNSEYLDEETSLIYLRDRYYSPKLRRFINRDSTPTFNHFTYANSNPIMFNDPSGDSAAGIFAGFGVGLLLTLLTGGIGGFIVGTGMAASITVGAVAGAVGSVGGDAVQAAVDHESFSAKRAIIDVFSGAVAGGVGAGVGGSLGRGTMRLMANASRSYSRAAIVRAGSLVSGITGGITGSAAGAGVTSLAYQQPFFSSENALNIFVGGIAGAGGGMLESGAYLGWFSRGDAELSVMPLERTNLNSADIVPYIHNDHMIIDFNGEESSQWRPEENNANLYDLTRVGQVNTDVVIVHGLPNLVFPSYNGQFQYYMHPENFAVELRNLGFGNGGRRNPIKLISCYTGFGGKYIGKSPMGNVAQYLATTLDVNVYASWRAVNVHETQWNLFKP